MTSTWPSCNTQGFQVGLGCQFGLSKAQALATRFWVWAVFHGNDGENEKRIEKELSNPRMEWLSLCSAKSKSLLGMCCKLCSLRCLSCANLHRPFSGAVNEPILLACTFRAALPGVSPLNCTPGGSKRRKTCLTGNGLKMSIMPRLAARRQAIGVLATEIHIPRNSKIFSHPRRVPLKDGTVFIVFPLRTLMVIYSYIY